MMMKQDTTQQTGPNWRVFGRALVPPELQEKVKQIRRERLELVMAEKQAVGS